MLTIKFFYMENSKNKSFFSCFSCFRSNVVDVSPQPIDSPIEKKVIEIDSEKNKKVSTKRSPTSVVSISPEVVVSSEVIIVEN